MTRTAMKRRMKQLENEAWDEIPDPAALRNEPGPCGEYGR